MFWFMNHYVPNGTDRKNPLLSPIYSNNLNKMPKTIIVIAVFDPLRDGCIEYAEKLKNHNIQVVLQIHSEQFHGFYHMNDVLPEAADAVNKTCQTINQLFKS